MLVFEILIFPILTMMGLAFLYSSLLRAAWSPWVSTLACGALFGIAVVLAMTSPIRLDNGMLFDLRGLLIGLAVVFGGWLAGLVTVVMGVAYRVALGGVGVGPAVLGMGLAFAIGLAWRGYERRRSEPDLVADASFGVFITTALGGLLLLPFDIAYALLSEIGPAMLLANVAGAVGLGFVLRREKKFVADTERLRVFASVDPLTQLLNRRGAAVEVEKIESQSQGGRALFYFDIDRFKIVNDIYGHAAGDEALATVANRIEGCVRERVIFARHGGDEFTLFMPNIREEDVASVAERFRRSVCDRAMYFRGEDIDLSISVGAYWTAGDASFEDMLHHADAQLLRAKTHGRNRTCFGSDLERPLINAEGWVPSTPLH